MVKLSRNSLQYTPKGLVYFSHDMGITWKDNSQSLPAATKVGLGAIAVTENSLGIASKDGVYSFDFFKNSWVSLPTNREIQESNPGALAFYRKRIYLGTQFRGVYFSDDQGLTWMNSSEGLGSLTVRKLVEVDRKMYAGTNGGLYSYNETVKGWERAYGNPALQVNGITVFDGSIYIATNQGVFKSRHGKKKLETSSR